MHMGSTEHEPEESAVDFETGHVVNPRAVIFIEMDLRSQRLRTQPLIKPGPVQQAPEGWSADAEDIPFPQTIR